MQLQRHAGSPSQGIAPPIVYEVLRSPGQPLDGATREFFEPQFGIDSTRVPLHPSRSGGMQARLTVNTPGDRFEQEADLIAERITARRALPAANSAKYDFSRVRVHTDQKAAVAARSVNAMAFTVGRDIVFGATQYALGSTSGQRLLAHELAHVVQQERGASAGVQRESESDGESFEADTETSEAPQLEDDGTATRADESTNRQVESLKTLRPGKGKKKNAKGACTRTIFAEGSCQHLVDKAAGRCCDPGNGLSNPNVDVDADQPPKKCPTHKFTPRFTCDNNCKTAVEKGCDDDDNWMAVPHNQFTRAQCDDKWTICANGKSTTGYVRDRSDKQKFEVSPGIQKRLGVPVGGSFKGSVFKPGAKQSAIDDSPCCKAPAPETNKKT